MRLKEYTYGTSINSKFISFIHRYLQYKIQKYFLYSLVLVYFTSYSQSHNEKLIAFSKQRYDIKLHVLSKQNIPKYDSNFLNKRPKI